MKKNLLIAMTVFVCSFQAFAADFVIQVAPSSKNWKVKNGTTVVAVLDRDPNGNTAISNSAPYISQQLGMKISGNINFVGSERRFAVKDIQNGAGTNQIFRVYYTSADCTGTPYTVESWIMDGVYRDAFNGDKIIYLKQNETRIATLTYGSYKDSMQLGNTCSVESGAASGAYQLSECSTSTCGFDSSSVLKLVYE